jgi:monoterpene epsilon-lactone hydrolase
MSVRARLINGALRVGRFAGIGRKSEAALHSRATLDPMLVRVRRFDKTTPPRRLRRRWSHQELDAVGSPLQLLHHQAGSRRRVLLYFHGGGFMVGPTRMHWMAMAELAEGGEADLAMSIYPKSPEHDHRATIRAAVAAYELVVARYGAENVVVGGDSAGGGLAASLLTVLRDREITQPHAALLISPWLDIAMSDPTSQAQAKNDLMLTVGGTIVAGRYYAGDLDPTDPLVSPRFASSTGLAPMHVFVGSDEIFLADCLSFVEKAKANGDPVTMRVMPRGQHVAAIFSTPEGRIARAQMLALIDWP